MNKTKSGKKAYMDKVQWIEVRFEEMMKSKGIPRQSTEYVNQQELFFQGASVALDEMPTHWKEKLARKEPI